MNTKKILTYGAIAAGAYLAYKFLFKKKMADANFANASGSGIPSWYSKYLNIYGINAVADAWLQVQRQRNWRNMTSKQQEKIFLDYMKKKGYKPTGNMQNVGSVIGSTPILSPSPAPTTSGSVGYSPQNVR
jgi:hypothetical protein